MSDRDKGRWPTVWLMTMMALGGCDGPEESATECTPAESMVVVVGVHQSMAAPDLPSTLECLLTATVASEAKIGVVAVDGTPHLVRQPDSYPVTGGNSIAIEDDVNSGVNQLLATVRGAKADSDGSDLLGAVAVAADAAGALDAEETTLVIIDSGLTDTGYLNMTNPGMIGARGKDVSAYLKEKDALPDLSGFKIILVGMGYTVSPQPDLSHVHRDAVASTWSTVLTDAGAEVTEHTAALHGEGPETKHTTQVVSLPEIAPQEFEAPALDDDDEEPLETELVFDDTSALGFRDNSDEFRDEAAARDAVRGIVEMLVTDSELCVVVTGTTANAGTAEGRDSRSTSRAERVKRLLEEFGAEEAQVRAVGAGYIADPPEDGDPGKAALNRSVRITQCQP